MDMYGPHEPSTWDDPSLEPQQPMSIELVIRGGNDIVMSVNRPEMAAPNLNPTGLGQGFGSTAQQEQFQSLEHALLSIVEIFNGAY